MILPGKLEAMSGNVKNNFNHFIGDEGMDLKLVYEEIKFLMLHCNLKLPFLITCKTVQNFEH